MAEPRILTDHDLFEMYVDSDEWLALQESDQCDEGPCGDDPDCPCNEREDQDG